MKETDLQNCANKMWQQRSREEYKMGSEKTKTSFDKNRREQVVASVIDDYISDLEELIWEAKEGTGA